MKVIEAKIVVLGSKGVGKTSIISRYTGEVFNKNVSPTIGATFFCCTLTIDDHRIKFKIWDTAGEERFRAMAPMYYRNANAAFLVYDVTSYESYMTMKFWVEELQRNIEERVFMCILGNKSDLVSERQVKSEDGLQYANMIGATFVETSAVTNDGVDTAFMQMAYGLVRQHQNTVTNGSNGLGAVAFSETALLQSPDIPEDEKPIFCC